MTFAEKLEFLIGHRRTSQSALSRQTGIAQSAISAMTRDDRRPYLDQAFRLARALEVSLDYRADEAQADPPASWTERERIVWELVRLIGPEQAWLRLVGVAHPGPGPKLLPPPSPKINREERG